MVDQELLQAIGQMMDEKLDPIKKEITGLKVDIEDLKDSQEATRSGVNALLDWAEETSKAIKFPLPKVK